MGSVRTAQLCAAQVMAISQLIRKEFGGAKDLSGIGGVETGGDAAEFLLLGANSVQVRCLLLQAPAALCAVCMCATAVRECSGVWPGAHSNRARPAIPHACTMHQAPAGHHRVLQSLRCHAEHAPDFDLSMHLVPGAMPEQCMTCKRCILFHVMNTAKIPGTDQHMELCERLHATRCSGIASSNRHMAMTSCLLHMWHGTRQPV